MVPGKRNVHGELYGFVRFLKVKDVGKLLKEVNDVCLGNFRVRAKVACFYSSAVLVGWGECAEEGVGVGVRLEAGKKRDQNIQEREDVWEGGKKNMVGRSMWVG